MLWISSSLDFAVSVLYRQFCVKTDDLLLVLAVVVGVTRVLQEMEVTCPHVLE
jgi:hypothetical protein